MSLIKAIGAAFSLSLLFINFPYDKLKLSCNDCYKITNDYHRDRLVKKIFLEHYKMVIDDIIENNVTFILPTGSRRCEMHMVTVSGDAFKRLRKSGKWQGVDFLKSWFTGHYIGFYMYSPTRPPRIKKVYVNKKYRDRIDELTNNGKTYC